MAARDISRAQYTAWAIKGKTETDDTKQTDASAGSGRGFIAGFLIVLAPYSAVRFAERLQANRQDPDNGAKAVPIGWMSYKSLRRP
ncbi:MAG TPA: hypothetical protein DD989_01535 [Pseudomonas sp.]|nr:hypothetical protein [Pseudomonas sp.]